jgi:hypothetical protein
MSNSKTSCKAYSVVVQLAHFVATKPAHAAHDFGAYGTSCTMLVVNRSKERKGKFRKKVDGGDISSLENYYECVMFGLQVLELPLYDSHYPL